MSTLDFRIAVVLELCRLSPNQLIGNKLLQETLSSLRSTKDTRDLRRQIIESTIDFRQTNLLISDPGHNEITRRPTQSRFIQLDSAV